MSLPLVLASTSPYRRMLLERLQIPFVSVAPNVDETALLGEPPEATALRLAGAKAEAVAIAHPGAVIVGSDQVAVIDGTALGKPGGFDAALAQLLSCRGCAVVFHTALCVRVPGRDGEVVDVPTTVHYRRFSETQARRYLELEQPYDCAGSAKIEGLGIALIERVDSTDPTALIGLPLIELVGMLGRANLQIPRPQ